MLESKFQIEGEFDSPGEKMSRANKRLWDLHSQELVKLSDEELCRNAQQGCVASRNLLWRRYHDFVQKVLYRQNQHYRLPAHEIADALQELYFAFHNTVQRYDPANHGHGKSASFKTFLGLIAVHLFSNYCTQWRRYHRRVVLHCFEASEDFCLSRDDVHTFAEKNDSLSANWTSVRWDDFFSDQLAEAVCRLKPKEKHLLEAWLHYGRDKDVAQVLGISPAAAKLRRERLFHRIRENIQVK